MKDYFRKCILLILSGILRESVFDLKYLKNGLSESEIFS
jgi:hypothetical protein